MVIQSVQSARTVLVHPQRHYSRVIQTSLLNTAATSMLLCTIDQQKRANHRTNRRELLSLSPILFRGVRSPNFPALRDAVLDVRCMLVCVYFIGGGEEGSGVPHKHHYSMYMLPVATVRWE